VERLKERLDVAQKALKTLREVLAETYPTVIVRDAAIQRFEYTFEAVWKAGQEFLRVQEGIDFGSPKGVMRGLFQTGYLNERQTELGLKMVDDRNLTSHTYSEGLSELIFKELPQYAALMQSCLSLIKKSLKKK
jgi:nucleotidyltransferase substrate binding protein (TIGR01987 family)